MNQIFDIDNPIWRFLGRICDVFALSVLWFLTSIPIITIGASTTALYYCILKLSKNQEGYLFRSYFRTFKNEFKQSLVIWIILLFMAGMIGMDVYICFHTDTELAKMLLWFFVFLGFVWCMLFTYIFPVLARCADRTSKLFTIAFLMSVKSFGWTLLMIAVPVVIIMVGLFAFWPLLLFAPGVTAYMNSYGLNHIFRKYNLSLPE